VRKKCILQIKGRNFLLGQRTWIMGILNVTPDSFSDGGLYLDKNKAVKRGLELAEEDADIIDIGGESTRPGSNSISTKEELKRIIPVLSDLREKTDTLISVDTTKSEVARAALDHGANIINDISALRFDPQMTPLAVNKDVPVVLMHMKGTPKNMQTNPNYEDLLAEVKSFFKERLETAKTLGIKREKIIIDPGIGFGKRHNDNLLLIKNLRALEEFERPIMIGISRKSFIGKILNLPVLERIDGTIASAVISIIHGAHILRVHDVAPIKRAVLVAEAIMEENRNPDSSINNMEKNYNYVC